MAVKTFEDLFVDELKDIYDAEKRITKALPKMARKANSEELSTAFEEHLEQTEEHIARLDQIFAELGKTPGRKVCEGMVGLLSEGEKMMSESEDETIADAAMIAAAQKVEHYEMATYGTLRDWARLLGHEDIAETLQKTLDEEGETDERLTRISESLNVQAAEQTEDSENEESSEEPEMAGTSRSTAGSRSTPNRGRTTGNRSRKH
jgi:ferritin-like metal-binding protein YciE